MGAMAATCATQAYAQGDPVPDSVEELKAALADLRRRLTEQDIDGALSAEQKLRTAQQQVGRLVGAIVALRSERDSLRAELGAARTELARRPPVELASRRWLDEAQSEIAGLCREIETGAAPPGPLLDALVGPEPPAVIDTVDGSTFAPGSAQLNPLASGRLDTIAARIRANPAATVRIVGYTDASGDEARNRSLSLARAEAIRTKLAGLLATDSDRFQVEGRGELDPVASNATADGRGANRRVVVTIEP